jgi:uncharacterized protein YhjY with autotransporter beta-barrel domain
MKWYRTIGPAAAVMALHASLMPPALAQLPPPPTNATPLQQIMFNAVAKMCVTTLDGNIYEDAKINDLHDQCHAIAGAALINGSTAPDSALGALQQVSGNEISTQGSLATRVSAGQTGNIAGRLNALRLGSSFALTQGVSARADSPSPGNSALAAAGPRSFYFDRSLADLNGQGQGSSEAGLVPVGNFQGSGSLLTTNYSSDGSVRVAQADSGGSARPSGSGGGLLGAGVANPWGFFVQGSYNSGRHDLTANEDPFDFHASSVTAGIDYNFGSAVLGASVGYDDFNAGLRASGTTVSGGSVQVQGTSASLYGAWFGQNWTFNGIATYGHLTTKLSRDVQYTVTYADGFDKQTIPNNIDQCTGGTCTVTVDRTLRGNPSGRSFAIGATAGYQYSVNSWDIVPSLSLNYRRVSFDSFGETDPTLATDGLAIAFGDRTIESLRSILGVALSRPVSMSFGVLTPIVRVEWDHEYKTAVRTIDAHYLYDPSCIPGPCTSNFALPTDAPSGNYGIAGAGISVTLARRVQAFVYDEALFGYSNYHSNSISLGVRAQF